MPIGSTSWRSVAADLARTVAESNQPLTLLIGAGASISSNAPTTAQVVRAFEAATKGRFGGMPVQQALHLVPASEKLQVLRPLFSAVAPYIGYRCIAALGKHRRVHILNLNWDTALETACASAGVPHATFDLDDRGLWGEMDNLPPDKGVVIAHVHGVYGYRCRFESLGTLKFADDQRAFIKSKFLSNTFVAVGAGIINDTDLHSLFFNEPLVERAGSRWYFGRPDTSMFQLEAMRRSLFPGDPLNYCCEPDVDFDELMVRLLGSTLDADWDRLRNYQPSTGLPPFDRLVWPEPGLLQPLLDPQIVSLLGQARLGKSVVGHLLAYLRALWLADGPWSRNDLPIRTTDGPQDSVAALSTIIPGEKRVYILENPFGFGNGAEENNAFVDALDQVRASTTSGVIILTNRLSSWPAKMNLSAANSRSAKSVSSVQEWFSTRTLRSYARRVSPQRPDLEDRIDAGDIRTPARLQDAILGVAVSRGSRDEESVIVADKCALLRDHPMLGWLCCILRLQEFCAEMLSIERIEAWLGDRIPSDPYSQSAAYRFQFDEIDRLRLAHDTDREAADYYISTQPNLLQQLEAGPDEGAPLVDAYANWKLLHAATNRDWKSVRKSPPTLLRQLAPELLTAVSKSAPMLRFMSEQKYDAWSIKDLSYELVRHWTDLRHISGARAMLERIFADREALGTYAVLEACLYMRQAVPEELWWKLYLALGKLCEDSGRHRELALAIDAFTWRPPPDQFPVPATVQRHLRSVDRSEGQWAIVRFLAGYHGGGMQRLGIADLAMEDATHGWNRDQAKFATWLLEWHFVHQSRARAQFARQPFVDKDFLCRGLHPSPADHSTAAANRLIRSFLNFPEFAGWGFFLGCNLSAVGQLIDDEGQALTRRALEASVPLSTGVIAAALTYQTASEYASELTHYFAREDNRELLLDGMSEGLTLHGMRLRPPRFLVNRNPVLCHADVGLKWGNLRRIIPASDQLDGSGHFNKDGLVHCLRRELSHLPVRLRPYGEKVVTQVEVGDFRVVDAAAAARSTSSSNPYEGILNRAANLLAAKRRPGP